MIVMKPYKNQPSQAKKSTMFMCQDGQPLEDEWHEHG